MTIGNKIARCRKKEGMSQEALAEKLGISRQAVSRWETGDAAPDTEKVRQLCRMFHVSADYLLFDEIEEMQEFLPQKEPEAQAGESAEKLRFRTRVNVALLVVGVAMIFLAVIAAYVQTLMPYQEYYTQWGPFLSYLLHSWKVLPFIGGILLVLYSGYELHDIYTVL